MAGKQLPHPAHIGQITCIHKIAPSLFHRSIRAVPFAGNGRLIFINVVFCKYNVLTILQNVNLLLQNPKAAGTSTWFPAVPPPCAAAQTTGRSSPSGRNSASAWRQMPQGVRGRSPPATARRTKRRSPAVIAAASAARSAHRVPPKGGALDIGPGIYPPRGRKQRRADQKSRIRGHRRVRVRPSLWI